MNLNDYGLSFIIESHLGKTRHSLQEIQNNIADIWDDNQFLDVYLHGKRIIQTNGKIRTYPAQNTEKDVLTVGFHFIYPDTQSIAHNMILSFKDENTLKILLDAYCQKSKNTRQKHIRRALCEIKTMEFGLK